ncbi:hypothetical protein Fmac_007849 [Flemingia macrophylla]|uniref:RRM domain-containing protein n=1 Tax=Flemingia macrophylla TaxID=520843 RepID=A0ABD1MVU7_9FABA
MGRRWKRREEGVVLRTGALSRCWKQSFMIRPLGGAGGLGLSPCLRWRKLKRRLSNSMAISRGGGGFSDSENRVHVGNLAWGVDNLALESLFREQRKVLEARVIYDRESGRSRGFGFVTYNSPDEDLNGRAIRVSMADRKPKQF